MVFSASVGAPASSHCWALLFGGVQWGSCCRGRYGRTEAEVIQNTDLTSTIPLSNTLSSSFHPSIMYQPRYELVSIKYKRLVHLALMGAVSLACCDQCTLEC